MGALTGNTVQSTYLDLVQLGKSGAGLPSHAGKEAALYDGAGYQILGRTAVRHWLDPHPDAASFDETWEFSTTGDMTQGQLEAAGWTFTACTAAVSGGLLVLTEAGGIGERFKASLSVSLAGDFDIVVTPASSLQYVSAKSHSIGGVGVADYRDGTADVAHYGLIRRTAGYVVFARYVSGEFTTLGGTLESDNYYVVPGAIRVSRVSSDVRIVGGSFESFELGIDETSPNTSGFVSNASVSDSSTFNKLFLCGHSSKATAGTKYAFASVRRFQ